MLTYKRSTKFGIYYHKLDAFDLAKSLGYPITLNEKQTLRLKPIKKEGKHYLLFFLEENGKSHRIGFPGDYLIKKSQRGKCTIIPREKFTEETINKLKNSL